MSTYTRRRCPRCGYVLENWHKNNEFWRTHIGPAVEVCPRCRSYLTVDSNVEFIMLKHPKLFIAQYLCVDLIKSVIFGGLIGLLLCLWAESESTLVKYACIIVPIFIFLILHCLALKKSIDQSLERTSEYEYRNVLRCKGLINISKLGEP